MLWIGWVNAAIGMLTLIGLVIVWNLEGIGGALGFLFFVFFVRVCLRFVNMAWTAFTGRPLFYDVKVLDRD